jgi:K(+)-stimulated pyrophosphate-energized sodium pump
VPTSSSANLGAFIDTKLPNGVNLHVPSNGIENKLLAFISDPTKAVDKTTWFSFDRLEFETDSATLKPSSREQLANVAAILKAYPQVDLKIGGYTDNSGDPAHNLNLSQNRATSTLNELVGLGVAKSRLAAEGYGQQFPVADNATPEGRQRNRRIDIRVTKK